MADTISSSINKLIEEYLEKRENLIDQFLKYNNSDPNKHTLVYFKPGHQEVIAIIPTEYLTETMDVEYAVSFFPTLTFNFGV